MTANVDTSTVKVVVGATGASKRQRKTTTDSMSTDCGGQPEPATKKQAKNASNKRSQKAKAKESLKNEQTLTDEEMSDDDDLGSEDNAGGPDEFDENGQLICKDKK